MAIPWVRQESAAVLGEWIVDARKTAMQTTDVEIVVDMSTVREICSRDLSELIRLHLETKERGRKLVLENTLDHLWEVFSLTRLDRLIEIRHHVST